HVFGIDLPGAARREEHPFGEPRPQEFPFSEGCPGPQSKTGNRLEDEPEIPVFRRVIEAGADLHAEPIFDANTAATNQKRAQLRLLTPERKEVDHQRAGDVPIFANACAELRRPEGGIELRGALAMEGDGDHDRELEVIATAVDRERVVLCRGGAALAAL